MIITLLLIPVCIFDNRVNHWYKANNTKKRNVYLLLFIWSIFFMINLQIAIVYLNAGISKISVEEWLNGTAVYYWFTHSTFGLSEGFFKESIIYCMSNIYIVSFLTWGAIIFEIILFTWIFQSKNKWNWKLILFSAILFHFAIALVHGLVSFMLAMIGCLILYCVDKEKSLNLLKKQKLWTKES